MSRTGRPSAAAVSPYEKSAHTRRRLIDACASVLGTRGYAGTRMSEISKIAGVRTPAIYYYFESREDLIEETMWAGTQRMYAAVRERMTEVDPGLDVIDRICILVGVHLETVLQEAVYAHASIRNAGLLPRALSERMRAEQAAYDELWRSLYDEAAAHGRLRPTVDARSARMLTLGALNWASEWYKVDSGDLDPIVATAQTMVRYGLATA